MVGGVGWFATSVAGWVVGKQCLSVASIGQVVGCVFSGHCRVSFVQSIGQGLGQGILTPKAVGRRFGCPQITQMGGWFASPTIWASSHRVPVYFCSGVNHRHLCRLETLSPISMNRRLPRFPCLRPATYNRGTPMRLMKLCWDCIRWLGVR